MSSTSVARETLLDVLAAELLASGAFNSQVEARPAAVLWPDVEGQWAPIAPLLRARLPVLTLGGYAPDDGAGPATWLRCMVARALPGAPDRDALPVLYLPGCSAGSMRPSTDYPERVELLLELQYRGAVWAQPDGRDWSAYDFLAGVGVAVVDSPATRTALLSALSFLAGMSLAQLRENAPWKASDFSALGAPALSAAAQLGLPELISQGESISLEFKSTARWNIAAKQETKSITQAVVKTVGAFMNSDHGGTLLIGVADDGSIHGIGDDYALFRSNQSPRDQYERWLRSQFNNAYGVETSRFIAITFEAIEEKDVCRITVASADAPVYAKEQNDEVFYVRTGNATEKLPTRAAVAYMRSRWPEHWR